MKFYTKDLGDGVVVVHLDGKLNMVTAPLLRELINSRVGNGDTHIAIDLSKVEFIDSSGLGALINGLKVTRQAGGDLRIAAPTAQVKLVLGLTNMERVLKSYDDAETAFST
jgi:anti-sigma B factor antagonist